MGITEALTLVFAVLKLIGKIDWSWWLVCLPEIIIAVFYLGILIWDVCEKIVYNGEMRKWRQGK